jgi:hypothetical protein
LKKNETSIVIADIYAFCLLFENLQTLACVHLLAVQFATNQRFEAGLHATAGYKYYNFKVIKKTKMLIYFENFKNQIKQTLMTFFKYVEAFISLLNFFLEYQSGISIISF